MTTMLRPGQRMVHLPGIGVRTSRRAVSAASGWAAWFDHFYIAKGAADLATSYTDLVGSQTLTAGVAPSTDLSAGWIMNGSAYLKTGLQATATWSMLCLYSDATANDVYLCGSRGTNIEFFLYTRAFANTLRWFYGNGNKTSTPNQTSGVMGLVGSTGYHNGTSLVTSIGTFTGTGVEIYIGASNNGGTPSFAGTSKIQAIGFKAGLITDVSGASTAMAAL